MSGAELSRMSAAATRIANLLLLGSLAFAGCNFDASHRDRGCEGCPAGKCVLGFCVTSASSVQPSDSGTGGTLAPGSIDGSMPGTATGNTPDGATCNPGASCYSGAPTTRGVGICRDGRLECDGAGAQRCAGEVTPDDEVCNSEDDDCDGLVDEQLDSQPCVTGGDGECTVGRSECVNGASVCHSDEPHAETCNGLDDDCDDRTDEGTDQLCYPKDEDGCTLSKGEYTCTGSCKAGVRTCSHGELSSCNGDVVPVEETCDDAEALDEDCDGSADEGCPCSGSEMQYCYPGPMGTNGKGICHAGTQSCSNGTFGPCVGAVVPGAERCTNPNSDDDCNGVTDDIPALGLKCIDESKFGECREGVISCVGSAVTCVTKAPESTETRCDQLDEDCDHRTDETFMLGTDKNNCGACGVKCGGGTQCCGGACIPLDDLNHCGACGTVCKANEGCCGGGCVAIDVHDRCGTCTNSCGAAETCCGGTDCADLTQDEANCGGCGVPCADTCCKDGCVDTDIDMANCGACDSPCPDGCGCESGRCVSGDGGVCASAP